MSNYYIWHVDLRPDINCLQSHYIKVNQVDR